MRVYIVQGDSETNDLLKQILNLDLHEVHWLNGGDEFLDNVDNLDPGCVILDTCHPDFVGLTSQSKLFAQCTRRHQMVILSGPCDVCDAVAAMRAGAVDFFELPFRRHELLDALVRAELQLQECDVIARNSAEKSLLFGTLTERELSVLRASSNGESSKIAAHTLGLSPRTVEMYRSKIIAKLGVSTFAAALVQAGAAQILKS